MDNRLSYKFIENGNPKYYGVIRIESFFNISQEFKNHFGSIIDKFVSENIVFSDKPKILKESELEILTKKLNDLIELEPYKGDIKIRELELQNMMIIRYNG